MLQAHQVRLEQTIHASATLCSSQSPYKGLPAEIWSEIFLYCLEGAHVKPLSRADQTDVRERQLPWALGRVCSGWRKMVLGEHRLWKRVHVPHAPLTLEGAAAEHYLNMARSLFSLSRGALISFSTMPYPKTIHGGVEWANPLLHLIAPHANQFRKLSIHSPFPWIYSMLELPPGSFLNLEALTLRFRGSSIIKATSNPRLFEAFRNSDCLRRVHFAGTSFCVYVDPRLISMPWEQLRYVTFDKVLMSFEAAAALLQQCKNIIECTLCFDYSPPSTLTTPLTLLHLQSLCLIFDHRMDRFLTLLTLPSLRSLKLNTSKRWLRWSEGTITQLIQRSGCCIEHFHSTVMIQADDMAPLLRTCPAIVELSIPSSFIPDPTVRSLISGDFAQLLETIDYTVDSMETFLDLVESRGIYRATGHFSGTGSDINSLPWDRYDMLRRKLLKDQRIISFKMS